MAETLVQTKVLTVTISSGFATSPELVTVTVPKPSKVNVGLSSKKADTSVSCAAVKSVMATITTRVLAADSIFAVMRTLSTGTSNRRASSALNVAESKGTSKGKVKSALTACMPDGIGVG